MPARRGRSGPHTPAGWSLLVHTSVALGRLSQTPLGRLLAALTGVVVVGFGGGRYLPDLSGLVLYLAPLLLPLLLLLLTVRLAAERWYELGSFSRRVMLSPVAVAGFLVAWVLSLVVVSVFVAGWQAGLSARPGPLDCPGLLELLPKGEGMCDPRWGEPGTAPFFHFQM